MIKVGDKIETWFSGQTDGLSTVVKVETYRGRYPEIFTHTLTVTAPRTGAGVLQMAYDDRGS